MSDMAIYGALSALRAYRTMFDNAAHNVANINTEPFRPLETVMQEDSTGGVTATTVREPVADRVDISKQAVDLMIAEFGIKVNAGVMKKARETEKSVIDLLA